LFSGKERDEETGLLYFGARYQDSKYGIWYSVDPLAEKSPNVSSYVYCLDNPVNAVDPDGKQAFFIHGTNSSPKRWNSSSVNTLMKLTNNKSYNTSFSWEKLAGTTNNSQDRKKAAGNLVDFVMKNRKKGEEITLIGHSHGGNVAVQAAKMIYEKTGEKVNLITIATPTYQDDAKQLSENPGTKPGSKAINDHIHIYNTTDGVQGGFAGKETYVNSPETTNYKIDVSSKYKSYEWLDAHSFDVGHPELIEQQMKTVKLKPVKK